MLLHDVIMTSYCCQRYAVSGNNFVPAGQCTGPALYSGKTAATTNKKQKQNKQMTNERQFYL